MDAISGKREVMRLARVTLSRRRRFSGRGHGPTDLSTGGHVDPRRRLELRTVSAISPTSDWRPHAPSGAVSADRTGYAVLRRWRPTENQRTDPSWPRQAPAAPVARFQAGRVCIADPEPARSVVTRHLRPPDQAIPIGEPSRPTGRRPTTADGSRRRGQFSAVSHRVDPTPPDQTAAFSAGSVCIHFIGRFRRRLFLTAHRYGDGMSMIGWDGETGQTSRRTSPDCAQRSPTVR